MSKSENTPPAVSTLGSNQNASTGHAGGKDGANGEWCDAQIATIVGAREKMRIGRPTKMTFRRLRRIIKSVEGGAPIRYAVAQGGVSYTVLRDWMEAYPSLSALVHRARNRAVTSLVTKVADGKDIKGQPDWKAAAWLLERTAKDEFASPKGSETTVNVTNNTAILTIDSQAGAALAEAYQRMLGGAATPPALPPADR